MFFLNCYYISFYNIHFLEFLVSVIYHHDINWVTSILRQFWIILSPDEEWRKIFFLLLPEEVWSKMKSCYSILFSNLNLKKDHNIIIIRVISIYLGPMHIETPYTMNDTNSENPKIILLIYMNYVKTFSKNKKTEKENIIQIGSSTKTWKCSLVYRNAAIL